MVYSEEQKRALKAYYEFVKDTAPTKQRQFEVFTGKGAQIAATAAILGIIGLSAYLDYLLLR